MANYSVCGIDCDICKFKTENNCMGCHEIKGKVFWGDCQLYSCCKEKNLKHCGKCNTFPCDELRKALEGENALSAIDNLKSLLD
jgi:hypothetical protein